MTHPAFRAGYVAALARIVAMVRDGASPADVAAFIRSLGILRASVARAVIGMAADGTYAAAVVPMLAD